MLPGTGRDPLFLLSPEDGPEGFAVLLDGGEAAGQVESFDQPLVDAMNVLASILRSPRSFADGMEAAGSITLERSGAILDARVPAIPPAGAATP